MTSPSELDGSVWCEWAWLVLGSLSVPTPPLRVLWSAQSGDSPPTFLCRKSLGCLPSPCTPQRGGSQLDSSAKCPSFSPHPAPSTAGPLLLLPLAMLGRWSARLGWGGGDRCPSSLPRGGAQPDSALPALSFSTHSLLGCAARCPQPQGPQRVRAIDPRC